MIGFCLSRLGYTRKTQTSNHFQAHMKSIDIHCTLFIHSVSLSLPLSYSYLYLLCSLDIGFYLELFFRLENGKPQKSSLKKEKKCEPFESIQTPNVCDLDDIILWKWLLIQNFFLSTKFRGRGDEKKKSSFVRLGCMQNGPLPKRWLVLD